VKNPYKKEKTIEDNEKEQEDEKEGKTDTVRIKFLHSLTLLLDGY